MNNQQLMQKRNQVKNFILMSGRVEGVLRWSANETWAHKLMKFKICDYLKSQGKEFYCEARFKNGGRADIVIADDGIIIEVLNSESEESIEKKKDKYPFPIIKVYADQEFNEKLIQ